MTETVGLFASLVINGHEQSARKFVRISITHMSNGIVARPDRTLRFRAHEDGAAVVQFFARPKGGEVKFEIVFRAVKKTETFEVRPEF